MGMSLKAGAGGVRYTSGRQRPRSAARNPCEPGAPRPRGQHLPDRGQAAVRHARHPVPASRRRDVSSRIGTRWGRRPALDGSRPSDVRRPRAHVATPGPVRPGHAPRATMGLVGGDGGGPPPCGHHLPDRGQAANAHSLARRQRVASRWFVCHPVRAGAWMRR